MISKTGKGFDVVLVTAEYYDDHPLSPTGVIARVLEANGFSVGIIEKPLHKQDYTQLGQARLFFGVTSGSIDSMLNNYTPLKKERIEKSMPERAVIVYCNKIRENFPRANLIIGGIEASLRRFAHYDYWDNAVRKSILLDSRANVLVYGNGEKQIIEISRRIRDGRELTGIEGTCILSKIMPNEFMLMPSFKEVENDKIKFCKMQCSFSNKKNLAQEYDNNFVLQYKSPEYTREELDWIYSLPYTRTLHPKSELGMARFSVVTHRGCIGNCNFCSIALHQGDKIISRSEESILDEIKKITKHPEFKGYIDDLGGPSANMYGMDCKQGCEKNGTGKDCMKCDKLDRSHSKLVSLLRKAREIRCVKKIFVRSGIRYDLAMESSEYLKELSDHHISGCLKIAPEHFSERVLKLMNKEGVRFEEFLRIFNAINKPKKQYLTFYLMIGHPGDSIAEVKKLALRARALKNIEQFQLFTPTPMTNSTCMYWTGMEPCTLKKVPVVYKFKEKKILKKILLDALPMQGEYAS